VPIWFWAALAVALVVSIATGFFALGRGLAAWRDYRRLRRRAYDSQTDLTKRLMRLERTIAATERHTARIAQAQAELQASIARAKGLADAVGEVQALVAQVAGAVPKK